VDGRTLAGHTGGPATLQTWFCSGFVAILPQQRREENRKDFSILFLIFEALKGVPGRLQRPHWHLTWSASDTLVQ
jgi:hypothetical protein